MTFVALRGPWYTNTVNEILCYPVVPLLDAWGVPLHRWRELAAFFANAGFWGGVIAFLFHFATRRCALNQPLPQAKKPPSKALV